MEYRDFLHSLLNIYDISQRKSEIDNRCKLFGKTKAEVDVDLVDVFNSYIAEQLRAVQSTRTVLESKLLKAALDEWLKNHIPEKKDREDIYESMRVRDQESVYYGLSDLFALTTNKHEYIVSELLRRGEMILLAAAPKTGKSLLATNLAVSILTGELFLGRKTFKSNILFINNEENPQEVGKRIYYQGFQDIEATDKQLFTDLVESDSFYLAKYLDIVADFQEIKERVIKHDIQLIIVDSLGASIKKAGLTEHSPELLPYLYTFQEDICHKLNVSCVVLHHTTKMDKDDNKTSMLHGIAGGSFLVRANDGYWKLMPDKKVQGTVNLTCVPRNDKEKMFSLVIEEGEACKWQFAVTAESSIPESELNVQNDILHKLKELYDGWFSQSGVGDVPGVTLQHLLETVNSDKKTLIRILNRMLHSDGIERYIEDNQHVYHYPESGESWLEIYLIKDADRFEKEKARQDLVSLIQSDLKPLFTDGLPTQKACKEVWEKIAAVNVHKLSVLNLMEESEKDLFLSCFYNSKYKGGQEVSYKNKKCKVLKVIYNDSKFIYVLDKYKDSFVNENEIS